MFKGSDRPPGFDPASWNILRPEHKAQVLNDLKTAEQAGGVGGLHASLPSDANDEPAAPVRTVLSSHLSAEASAFCPATGAPFVCVPYSILQAKMMCHKAVLRSDPAQ